MKVSKKINDTVQQSVNHFHLTSEYTKLYQPPAFLLVIFGKLNSASVSEKATLN